MKRKGFTLAEVGFSGGCSDSETRNFRSSVAGDKISDRNLKPVQEQNSRIIRYNRAFTLAEVLITLGIIGVVAAMTIPTLMANIRSHQYRSKFKKAVSTISQAARMSQAQYDYDFSGIEQICGNNGGTHHPEKIRSICSILNGALSSSTYYNKASDIKISKNSAANYEINYTIDKDAFLGLNSGRGNLADYHAYLLNDGTIIAFHKRLGESNACYFEIGYNITTLDAGSNKGLAYCYGFIDVNGPSLPNKEISCSTGKNNLEDKQTCIVKPKDVTDIYPIRIYNGIAVPATAAVKYIFDTAK